MPTYEARCKSCGAETEYIRKIDDRNNTPTCCGVAMEKIIKTAVPGSMDHPWNMSQYKHLYQNRN